VTQNVDDGNIMSIPGAEDKIDASTFEQILEMDDDEDEREFSKSIVYDFFTQAESTFEKMDANLYVFLIRDPQPDALPLTFRRASLRALSPQPPHFACIS